MKKAFVLTQFGTPHDWTQKFIDHVQHLGKYGWEWFIFTPNEFKSKGNVHIVKMSAEEFSDLVEIKLGIRPNMYVTASGVPSVHVTDFYVFTGVVFEDWLRSYDFWGITNIDVVYGRLDHYLTDEFLATCDVFTDDVEIINGVFSLYRNTPEVNNLWKKIPNWQNVVSQPACQRCLTGEGRHTLFGSDEYGMTDVMKDNKILRYKYPAYYPLHSYDRLYQHIPEPRLEIQDDGSLWERFYDATPPTNYVHFLHGYVAKEIMYFHFIKSKKFPKLRKYHEPL